MPSIEASLSPSDSTGPSQSSAPSIAPSSLDNVEIDRLSIDDASIVLSGVKNITESSWEIVETVIESHSSKHLKEIYPDSFLSVTVNVSSTINEDNDLGFLCLRLWMFRAWVF